MREVLPPNPLPMSIELGHYPLSIVTGKFSPSSTISMAVYSSAALLAGLKSGELTFSEPFKSPKGELLSTINGRLCYISKSARADFEACKVSGYCIDVATNNDGEVITLKDGSELLILKKEGMEHPTKQGNWH